MNDTEALEFAEDVFADVAGTRAVVVASELLRDKHSPSTARRRLNRLIQRVRDFVSQGHAANARSLVQSADWIGPPMLWWCDSPNVLQSVLQEVYGVLESRKQRDGYDLLPMSDEVVLMQIWHDR